MTQTLVHRNIGTSKLASIRKRKRLRIKKKNILSNYSHHTQETIMTNQHCFTLFFFLLLSEALYDKIFYSKFYLSLSVKMFKYMWLWWEQNIIIE